MLQLSDYLNTARAAQTLPLSPQCLQTLRTAHEQALQVALIPLQGGYVCRLSAPMQP